MIPKIVLKSVLWRGSESARYFCIFQLLCFSLHPSLMYTLIAGLGLWVLERCYLACVQWNEDTRGMLVGAGKTRWASLPGRIRPMTLLFRNWISNIARDEQLISHIFHWISPQQKWVSWFSAVFSTIFLNCFPWVGSWFHTCEIFSYFA